MTELLIGRSSEQHALDQAVATMQAAPCAVVLEGDAGIGKTSLWDHARRCADRMGVRVLVARSTSSESAYAFAVLGDLLTPVLDETLADLPSVQRRALEVALALREPGASPPDARVLGLGLLAVLRGLLTHLGLGSDRLPGPQPTSSFHRDRIPEWKSRLAGHP